MNTPITDTCTALPSALAAGSLAATGPDGMAPVMTRLADQARRSGWVVSTWSGPGRHGPLTALFLTGRVATITGSEPTEVRCVWETDNTGRPRWRGACVHRSGTEETRRIGWRLLSSVLHGLTASLVDPAPEAAGRTCHGSDAQHWAFLARGQAHQAHTAAASGRRAVARVGPAGVPAGPLRTAAERTVRRLERRAAVVGVLAARAEREAYRAGGARRVFELSGRARLLAASCVDDAQALDLGALDLEAEEVCSRYVARDEAALAADEARWRRADPDGTPADFAKAVLRTVAGAERDFAAWWADHGRAGMTFLQGWDVWHGRDGHATAAEVNASLRHDPEQDQALFTLGIAAAAVLARQGDQDQVRESVRLAEAAAQGAALFAPGAARTAARVQRLTVEVWALLGGSQWGLSLDMSKNVPVVEAWLDTAAGPEAAALRHLMLVRHGLDLRNRAHDAVRAANEAAERQRDEAARAVFEAALDAGQSLECAREAGADARARLAADAEGRPDDGRGRLLRGLPVWVEPGDADQAPRSVARIACYRGQGTFRVRPLAGEGWTDVPGDRLTPATDAQTQADRERQLTEHRERQAVADREKAAAQARAEQQAAEQRAQEQRLSARAEAVRHWPAPVAESAVWQPAFPVPETLDTLWRCAARNGWLMTRRTRGSGFGSAIAVNICGTTDRGRWVFDLVWTVAYGRYRFDQQASAAVWADRRSGPRGGQVRPGVTAVLAVMAVETVEGAAAPLGFLAGVTAGDAAGQSAP
ncbi:hypothetical protein ACFWXO_30935 [Kitasatospora sp. NPDC059088]|uniref:hypothetical protein n=1 Tax=Kitasatospora sp. NPDC059088 TaxID=3346722 RepID=UPI0036934BAE